MSISDYTQDLEAKILILHSNTSDFNDDEVPPLGFTPDYTTKHLSLSDAPDGDDVLVAGSCSLPDISTN